MSEPSILVQRQAGYRVITLNRPDRLNAFNDAMHEALRDAIDDAEDADDCRALLLTGAGRAFCSGQDLSDRLLKPGEKPVPRESLEKYYNPLVRRLRGLAFPVVGAVNGVAAGAGANVALACDIVIAARSATFTQSFARIGLIPDSGGTYILPRLIGEARAMEMIYTGRIIGADEADRYGLLNRLVEPDDLLPTALDQAELLAKGPTLAIGLAKENIRQNAQLSIEDALRNERRSGEICGKSEDAKEGLAATLERREANFKGR